MTFDMFESAALDTVSFDLSGKLSSLRTGFESSLESNYDAYMEIPESVDGNIKRWLGMDTSDMAVDMAALRTTAFDIIKQMYNGTDLSNGKRSLGLREINERVRANSNSPYYDTIVKQQSGFTAEIIGTAKENLQAIRDGSGITTYRADDLPDLFPRNDQYVDKVRINNATGEIIDRIQVKFVGKNADECLAKLTSHDFDKYYNDGIVNKMEIPSDYYDGIKERIPQKISKLEEALKRVNEKGNTEVAKDIEKQIDRFQKIDDTLERSLVSSDEATQATLHPRRYVAKLFAPDAFAESHKAGMESAAIAVTITAAVSTVDNVSKVIDGEITAKEAFVDVAKDTGTAGGLAYGTAFVSTAVAQTMSSSGHELIKSLGGSGVPAAVISFGVQSFDSVVDYANGVIDGRQLAYDLGENAAQVGGGIAGAALTGAAVGSVVPGAGTAVGFAAGMVGGMVGCAVASEAYVSAVEFGAENAGALADKAKEMADRTVDIAKEVIPDKVDNIVASINNYAIVNHLPFSV